MSLFQVLKERTFALLWSGQTASRLGDSLYRIALSWWVLQKTGSATTMGAVLIFSFTPLLIFLLIGGAVADRFPRMRLMFASDILRGVLVAIVALLAALDALQVWHILLASIVFGFVDAFFQPAYAAIMPEIVPAELLNGANSLSSLSGQLSGVVGPALGAFIIQAGSTSLGFALDSASFFIAALCVLPMLRLKITEDYHKPEDGILSGIKDGLLTVRNSPWLWITILVFGFANVTTAGPMAVALPFLVKNTLRADVNVLGLILSANAVGSIVGTIGMGLFKKMHRRGLIAYGASILFALMLVVTGLTISVAVLLAAGFVFGIGMSIFGMIWVKSVQDIVPLEKLGRVFSVDLLGSFVLLPIGFGISGWLTDRIPASTVFILGGGLSIVMFLAALLHPAIREFD